MKKFKIGDNVKVIQGKDKGQTGTIKSLSSKNGKIVIEGINTKVKHVKPSRKDEAGKIIQFDAPIDVSNVMLCDENGVAGRVGFSTQDLSLIHI